MATLIPLICDECDSEVSKIVAEGGPVLLRHENRYRVGGSWVNCRHRWVVVPDGSGGLTKHEVRGRNEPTQVLEREAERWLEERS